jgi:DNA-binding GntR family transcriptional regulator
MVVMDDEPGPERVLIPQYVRIADDLRGQIITGAIRKGQKLPAYSHIRDTYGVSISTAQEAIRLLSDEGYVKTSPGRGAFVISTRPNVSPGAALEQAVTADLIDTVRALTRVVQSLERRLDRFEAEHAPPTDKPAPSTPPPDA